jgi:hypothetical protein
MAYFPHAYKKVFIARSVDVAGGTGSDALTAGEVALLDKSFQSVAAGAVAGNGLYTLAQGSLHSVDKLGPFHGGYQESVKSKGINPKFVSKIWTVEPKSATASKATIEVADAETFTKGETVFLRVDVKGSPALRFLGRNSYFVADYTVQCADGATVEPAKVLLEMASQIENEPLVGPFVSAAVETFDGAAWNVVTAPAGSASGAHASARLVLTGAYVDTKFGDCSFSPMDHFEKEPVQLLVSELNESGDICVANFQDAVIVAGMQGEGFGESVIREFILSNRYAQDDFQTDPRMREILDDIALTGVSRTAEYKTYNILHSIPRSYNPSGMHNSDQYLLTIAVEAGAGAVADMDTLVNALASAADVTIEAL